jgi:hypothetical protein
VVDAGGNFYLGYYFSAYGLAAVPKLMIVHAGKSEAEPWATAANHHDKGSTIRIGTDGPGMQSGWFCGPHFSPTKAVSPWGPPGVIVCHAHDESQLRRITPDGRVSTLYRDGEWHEAPHLLTEKDIFRGMSGFVYYGPKECALACCSNEGMDPTRGEGIYLFRNLDLAKATVGK